MAVCFIVILLTSIANKRVKWKYGKNLVVPIVDQNRDLNTLSRNKELISPVVGFAIVVIALLAGLQYEMSELLQNLIMGLLPLVINYGILPLICYFVNPELRKYVKNIIMI